MQYLVTMDFVDPGPLLAPQQYLGMMRAVVLPGHEVLSKLKTEGKILAGGFPVGERAIALVVEADSPKELDSILLGIHFLGNNQDESGPAAGLRG